MRPLYYYLVTLITYAIVVILSVVVPDVTVFFGVIGSTSGSSLVIGFPGIFYVLTIRKHKIPLVKWYEKLSYVLGWVFAALGVIGVIGFNTCVIINAVS